MCVCVYFYVAKDTRARKKIPEHRLRQIFFASNACCSTYLHEVLHLSFHHHLPVAARAPLVCRRKTRRNSRQILSIASFLATLHCHVKKVGGAQCARMRV
jgi:hypothetical protein